MTQQKTLFPEPEPERIDTQPGCDSLDDDEPPFGPLMYLQELYIAIKGRQGKKAADIKTRRVWANYRQTEEHQ